MKIDFGTLLKQLDGSTSEVTLGEASVRALVTTLPGDEKVSGEDKFKWGQLAERIYKAGKAKADGGDGSAELTVDEVSLLKRRIGALYDPRVVYAAWTLLEELSSPGSA